MVKPSTHVPSKKPLKDTAEDLREKVKKGEKTPHGAVRAIRSDFNITTKAAVEELGLD